MKLLSQGAKYVLGTVAPILVMLAITPLVTRRLGAVEYGEVAVALTVAQSMSVAFGLGLPASITRHMIIERGGDDEGVSIAVSGALFGLVGSLVLAGLLSVMALTGNSSLGLALAGALISASAASILQMCQAILRARDHPVRFVILSLIYALIPPSVALLGVSVFTSTAIQYVLVLAILQLSLALASLAHLAHFKIRLSPRKAFFHAVRIGLPTIPHLFAGTLLVTGTVAIARAIGGPEAAGSVQIAALVGTAPLLVLNAINNAWAPAVYRTEVTERQKMLDKTTTDMSLVSMLLALGFLPLIPWMISFIGGPAVLPTTQFLAILISASAGLHLVYLANIHLTFASGKTWPLSIVTPASSSLALLALLITIKISTGALMIFGVAWLTYYFFQALAAMQLSKFAGYRAVSLKNAWPQLCLSCLTPLFVVIFKLNSLQTAIGSFLALTVGVLIWILVGRNRSTKIINSLRNS